MIGDWQPSCTLQQLHQRAQLLASLRQFFAERQVLEVETPLLCHTTGTDPQLDFFATPYHHPPHHTTRYLQTSPEFAMKRLLAAGSGSIYQICKAFRNGEQGRYHNPEFTILEWYRVGFSVAALMAEVAALLQMVVGVLPLQTLSYQALFQQHTGLDALQFVLHDYQQAAEQAGVPEAARLCGNQHALWLDLLFSHCVQPAMQPQVLYLVYDYPAVQSSLARSHPADVRLVERFEVFINGMELGNGFGELSDATEQARRFEAERAYRQQHGLPPVEPDSRLLAALDYGLPQCSGVALGLDRLLMCLSGHDHIDAVLAFPFHNA